MKPCRSLRVPARAMRLAACAIVATALVAGILCASPAFAGPLVVIDAGHGGPFNHAHYGSLTEKAANLLLALELGAQLHASGYDIAYTRTTDTAVGTADIPTWNWIEAEARWLYAADGIYWYDDDVPRDDLQARSNAANEMGADIFISIHCNGASSSLVSGTENWASANDARGQELGQYVQGAVLELTHQRNRGSGVQSFYVTKWSNMPALLVETGFMSNPTEGSLIANASWRRTYVTGIVNGMNRWMSTGPFRPFYERYFGSSSSSTAVCASRWQWTGGAPAVILASVYDPVSAYVAPLASAKLNAPVLFADQTGLTVETVNEIARLHPTKIIALGSSKMLPDAFLVQAAAAARLDPSAVTRFAGTEAAGVAPLVSESVVSTSTPMTLVVANGARMTDSLAAAQVAASRGAALVLTRGDGSLPPEAAAFVAKYAKNITSTVFVGAVSGAAIPTPNRTQIGFGEAFADNVAVINATRPSGLLWMFAYSTGSPTDAVVATTAAVRVKGVAMPISSGRVLSPYSREWIENTTSRVYYVTMVGDFATLPTLADYMIEKARQ